MGSNSMLTVVFFMIIYVVSCNAHGNSFPITKYGAKAGADVTEAMMSAYKEACAASGPSEVVVPKGTYLLQPQDYDGPCKAPSIKFVVEGTLQQPKTIKGNGECWIDIRNVQRVTLTGGGILDGQGHDVWGTPKCSKDPKQKGCQSKLKNVCFFNSNNSMIQGITSLNSKTGHLNIYGCSNTSVDNINITAPDTSPNTDGIHFGTSTGCRVTNSVIGTGDDCIGIVDNVHDLTVTNVTCGPGHGISVGSLGGSPNGKPVTGIHVENCTFKGTSNGARIKSWPGKYENTISDITFTNIRVENVSFAIVIDQTYGDCYINRDCPQRKSKATVIIDKFSVKDLKGTTSEPEAIILNCLAGGCTRVELGGIDVKYVGSGKTKIKGVGGSKSTAKCLNVDPTVTGTMNPPCSS